MIPKIKNFETFFRVVSYAVVFCGFLSLVLTGGLGVIPSGIFFLVLIGAWFLENTRWQISERVGTGLLFAFVPLFYIGWRYKLIGFGENESAIAGMLARMILILAAIKLFQRKTDRDWLFLYLMAFFEVLLAAGMSISPLYFASLILYLLVNICAIISFEVRKTSRLIGENAVKNKHSGQEDRLNPKAVSFRRLPLTAFALLVLIVIFAVPLFFALPRVGGAGFGNNGRGVSSFTGFSDRVSLGAIGQLKQSDEIVMRVALVKSAVEAGRPLRWRGVMLDTFDNKTWTNSGGDHREPFVVGKRFDRPALSASDIAVQTIYLEPIDSKILFALARPYAAEQSSFQIIYKDSEGAIGSDRSHFERVSYKVYSDRRLPGVETLRADNGIYSREIGDRYLQKPARFDQRIARLAERITAAAPTRYDKAKAVEGYLQNNFGYSLEMKAGGEEPLADFLFNVRQGHCEYFATAMAFMLRTQGIATRVVNGFQQGEYNETAEVYVVRQKDAHSWVEVYFPEEDAWVPFDPTPFAGQFQENGARGIWGTVNQYAEALETLWIKYFVSYDNQGQRSLFRSMQSGFAEFQTGASAWLKMAETQVSEWWREVRGDRGLQASALAIAYGVGYILAAVLGLWLIVRLYRKIRTLETWRKLREWLKKRNEKAIVEFYERMQKILAGKGFKREPHQTPLEFACALKMPEAVLITEKYNRVRFGEKNLSSDEAREIEDWLEKLENQDQKNKQ
ncbi:MAG: DUF3488 and transglutaminase-like domain-containing protein [Pyrinomonadaceae bacterium]